MVLSAPSIRPIPIRPYAGRRLDQPAAGSHLPLDDLARMVEDEVDFITLDADGGFDITSSILQQIIHERALHG